MLGGGGWDVGLKEGVIAPTPDNGREGDNGSR